MGAAASAQGPLQRARKIVTIRAYNARPANETVSEQFGKLCRVNASGDKVLHIQDVKDAIGLSQPWFDELLLRVAGNEVGELVFDSFLEFLHDGSMPIVSTVAEPKNPSPRRSKQLGGPRSSFSMGASHVMPPPEPPKLMGFSPLQPSGLASSPIHLYNPKDTRADFKQPNFNQAAEEDEGGSKPEYDSDSKEEMSSSDISAIARRSIRDNKAVSNEAMYPDVFHCLNFKRPTTSRELTVHPGFTLSLNRKDCHKKSGPSRPLWRKRETVIHERIVHYTTVDADGTTQELVESERSQNEIVHLECKETGDFAHRESQLFEQLETFNDEVVAHEVGNEEYIHMKSKDDEYEHLESNMPTKMSSQGGPGGVGPEEEAAQEAHAQAEAEAQAASAFAAFYDPETSGAMSFPPPGTPGAMLFATPPDPTENPNFSEQARQWWEGQQIYQYEQNQQRYSQEEPPSRSNHEYKFDSGGSPSQADFDADAQKWWEEQQSKQQDEDKGGGGDRTHRQQYPQTNTPTPSQQAELDEDAQKWWSEQQKKQQQFGNQPQAASPSPLKFNIGNHEDTPFSPHSYLDPASYQPTPNSHNSGTEKENEWWPRNNINQQQPEQPQT